jgi:putative ABC transport system substrate-binding protein
VALLLCPSPTARAQAPRVFKIGILTSAWSPWHSNTEGFREALKALGYIEGQTVTFEVRAAQGDPTRLPQLAAELVQQKPDLLYCVTAPDAQACQKATATIPTVFTQASDPVKFGLVKSLARPGGNLTGIGSLRAELTAKRLELFKETVPSLRRVLVTYDRREPEEQEAVTIARGAARHLGLTLLERPITAPLEIEPALAELSQGGRDGILIVQAGVNLNIPGRSLEVATSNKLPTMYPDVFWTQFGALASYGPGQHLQGRQAARLAHKILTGTAPAEIPVELPDRIEFVINLKAAKRLGLEVPRPVLFRADRVIE